ncbi:MAG: hypothetical protein JO168_01250 [Solirubrobacterales bacterium]|nr:hypothetical protein [Solirubrobacterales bacterium]MBV9715973.1 hypothetical protein [Solirubrobacterales bacterium]
MTTQQPSSGVAQLPLVEIDDIRRVMEHYAEHGWTDGLPVMPVTESYLSEFFDQTTRDPDEVLVSMTHLDRECTVRLAAINAAMAGCLPEYFPVVVAAWAALDLEGYVAKGIWQSTTGTAPMLLVNGAVREKIGLNAKGNVFGSGFRANATIGRAIRLTAINVFGLRPHELDQATQGNPAKYTACIAENEEESPWPALPSEYGFDDGASTVTALTMRSVVHIEARHTTVPEQLATDIAGTIARTGALIHETISACIALGPEHAHLFAGAGWTKADLRRFVYEHATNSREALASAGKDALSAKTRWRLAGEHPDSTPDTAAERGLSEINALTSEAAVLVIVAGARNAGVSAVIETFGPRGGPPAIARVE